MPTELRRGEAGGNRAAGDLRRTTAPGTSAATPGGDCRGRTAARSRRHLRDREQGELPAGGLIDRGGGGWADVGGPAAYGGAVFGAGGCRAHAGVAAGG